MFFKIGGQQIAVDAAVLAEGGNAQVIATTGDIYAHLDVESKVASAEAIIELLPAAGLPEDRKTAANHN